MSAIALSRIRKSFGATEVLKDVDLAIRPGEFLTLVGPSGCGKSTLLRILAGLENPTSGDVRIGDRLVNSVRASDRNLAMVFQSYALYPHLTVAENMLTPLRLRDLTFWQRLPILGPLIARSRHRALRDQVAETASVLKIEALLERKPGQLSGGQRQRAALGRAMVRKPVAFLMDEPLSNLDAALRVHMRSELAELHRTLNATFVYVTHDQAEALTMSDRMAVMMDGRILQLDEPQTIYDDPTDIRVAEFVGSPKINLLPGTRDGNLRVTCLGVPLQRALADSTTETSRTLTVGLRPEHLRIVEKPGDTTFEGRVVHRENLGADIYLHLALNDGEHRLIVRGAPHETAHTTIGSMVHAERVLGEALAFAPDGTRLHFADRPKTAAEPSRQAVA